MENIDLKEIKPREWKERIDFGKEKGLFSEKEEESLNMILVKLGYSMMLSVQDYERLEKLYKMTEENK